jgi:hypothetical protein
MDRRAQLLGQFFTGKGHAFAVQKADGSYLKVDRELTLGVLEDHVAGRITVAVYPVLAGTDRVQFGVIDLDSKSPQGQERLLWLKGWLGHLELSPLIEPSGGKGYHLWLVLKSWIPASKVRRLLGQAVRAAEEDLGVPAYGVEVFPKQDTGAGLGSAVKLPWGIHRKSGRRTAFVHDDLRTVLPSHGVPAVEALPPVEEAAVDDMLAEWPPQEAEAGGRGHTRDEIVDMLARPVAVGQRRPTLIRLAGYLRYRGIPEEVALALLLPWARGSFAQPLPLGEIERHVRGIYRRYGLPQRGHTGEPGSRKLEVPL